MNAITTTEPGRMTRATTDEHLIASWLQTRDSAGTRETYRKVIFQFVEWLEDRPLSSLTVEDLNDYKERLAKVKKSRYTQALYLAAVKSLLTYGHKLGYLPFNVGVVVKAAQPPNDLAERILEEWQVLALINHKELRARDRLILRLLYATGCRVSELVRLRWRNVQKSGSTGQVTVTGKGDKTRAVKLSQATWSELLGHIPPDAGPTDFVFTSQKGGKLHPASVNKIVRKAGRLIDVPRLSPHWLRHAHASHALDRGAPISLVQATLGHDSLATTSRYTHAKPGESSGLYLGI